LGPAACRASMSSSAATTPAMDGRLLGSPVRHLLASLAARSAALGWYRPPRRWSMRLVSFLLPPRYGRAHSTRFCWWLGRFRSCARSPVSSSSSTTPKPYTSLCTYRCPAHAVVVDRQRDTSRCFFIVSWPPIELASHELSLPVATYSGAA
jgi:hypothetical protein